MSKRTTPDSNPDADPVGVSPLRPRSRVAHTLLACFEELPLSDYEKWNFANKFGPQLDAALAWYVEQAVAGLEQEQADAAEAAKREHAFEVYRHNDLMRMWWAILGCMLFVMFGCLGLSVWLIASGREQGGIVLAVATIGGLAYLAGFGTPRGKLWRGGPDSKRGG